MSHVADRMGSISQRAMLCHRGHHEVRDVYRWVMLDMAWEMALSFTLLGSPMNPEHFRAWQRIGKKCKHCGRWV